MLRYATNTTAQPQPIGTMEYHKVAVNHQNMVKLPSVGLDYHTWCMIPRSWSCFGFHIISTKSKHYQLENSILIAFTVDFDF